MFYFINRNDLLKDPDFFKYDRRGSGSAKESEDENMYDILEII